MEDLKGLCNLQLNAISSVEDDPTLTRLQFVILDFDVSGNKQIVSEELAIEASPTLRLKPLMCQYFKTTDYDEKNDHFGTHGEYVTKDRNGNDIIATNTIAIGTTNETGGYIGTIIDENGNEKSALLADFFIWNDKNPDIVALIQEMWDAGIPLKSSCEYLYRNYEVKDGIQYIQSPLIFTGHVILNSGENGTGIVSPAYNSSQLVSFNQKWEKAISQAILNQNSLNENKEIDINKNNNSQKEENLVEENKLYKALCELSHGDIRWKIMTELSKTMTADEFNSVWLSQYDVFDTYFIFERYFDDTYHYYKATYTKTDTEVTVDMESIEEVKRETVWTTVENMQNAINEIQVKLNDANTQLNTISEDLKSANATIETLNSEKETLTTQFNSATETITSLNSQVEEMKPIVEQFNAESVEKALNEKKEYYEAKFKAVNGLDTYNTEEVQELLQKSINSSEEGKDAILSLNSKLVDLVQLKVEEPFEVKQLSSKNEKLIPISTDFDSRYKD